jgi:hypothetical protein
LCGQRRTHAPWLVQALGVLQQARGPADDRVGAVQLAVTHHHRGAAGALLGRVADRVAARAPLTDLRHVLETLLGTSSRRGGVKARRAREARLLSRKRHALMAATRGPGTGAPQEDGWFKRVDSGRGGATPYQAVHGVPVAWLSRAAVASAPSLASVRPAAEDGPGTTARRGVADGGAAIRAAHGCGVFPHALRPHNGPRAHCSGGGCSQASQGQGAEGQRRLWQHQGQDPQARQGANGTVSSTHPRRCVSPARVQEHRRDGSRSQRRHTQGMSTPPPHVASCCPLCTSHSPQLVLMTPQRIENRSPTQGEGGTLLMGFPISPGYRRVRA